jgi:PAS domain-containing protein
VRVVADHVLERLADATTPQGVVAVARTVTVPLDEVVGDGLLVVLHEVADPGNAGTIVRTADAVGAAAVVATSGSVDLFAPKTVRAAAGSTYHLPLVVEVDLDEVAAACRRGDSRCSGSTPTATVGVRPRVATGATRAGPRQRGARAPRHRRPAARRPVSPSRAGGARNRSTWRPRLPSLCTRPLAGRGPHPTTGPVGRVVASAPRTGREPAAATPETDQGAAHVEDLSLFDRLPEAVVVVGSDGDVRHVNDRAKLLLGLTDDVLGKHLDDVLDLRDDAGVRCPVLTAPPRVGDRLPERVLHLGDAGHRRPVAVAGRWHDDELVLTARSAGGARRSTASAATSSRPSPTRSARR